MATKPSGWPEQQQRGDDADQAQRHDAQDQEQPAEALQLDHQHGDHDEQHQRHDGDDRGLRLRAFLDGAADLDVRRPAAGSASSSATAAASASTTASGSTPGIDVGPHGQGRHAGRAARSAGIPARNSKVANWLSGTVRPPGSGTCMVRSVDSETRCSSVARGDDVDQVDVVAHLGHDRAGHAAVQHGRRACRAEAEQARLVLVDAHAQLPRRLDPVEIDPPRAGRPRRRPAASRKAMSRTSSMSGPLTRYCTGQPTGGPSSSG